MIIIVSDNGGGIEKDMLEAMNDKFRNTKKLASFHQDTRHNGIALENVNSRIRILYGNEYGIHVSSTLGVGTQVKMILPMSFKTEDSETVYF